jgi:hypothetical protein
LRARGERVELLRSARGQLFCIISGWSSGAGCSQSLSVCALRWQINKAAAAAAAGQERWLGDEQKGRNICVQRAADARYSSLAAKMRGAARSSRQLTAPPPPPPPSRSPPHPPVKAPSQFRRFSNYFCCQQAAAIHPQVDIVRPQKFLANMDEKQVHLLLRKNVFFFRCRSFQCTNAETKKFFYFRVVRLLIIAQINQFNVDFEFLFILDIC